MRGRRSGSWGPFWCRCLVGSGLGPGGGGGGFEGRCWGGAVLEVLMCGGYREGEVRSLDLPVGREVFVSTGQGAGVEG